MQLIKSYLIIMALLQGACAKENSKIYHVNRTQTELEITGQGTDPAWEKANSLTGFTYPWRDEIPPSTIFKSLWSDTHLYFLYTVEDHDIVTPQRGKGELDAVDSDRVEIFFKADDEMNPYYALEMDAVGRCLDTEGRFYRNIDFNWDWPKDHFILKASQNGEGYIVEGSLTLESLRQLGLYNGDGIIHAGLYRGEYYHEIDCDVDIKWISWVIPDSERPDFHIPSSFGILKLES